MNRSKALMILGTASHVGKSLVTAAFCRLLADEGLRVAPFKAQNMALNSFVTQDGAEIGRAQVAQAEAAGIEPRLEMNPILLKPMAGVSQVIVHGAPCGVMSAREYYSAKDRLWPKVTEAYDRLASGFDCIVLEGAGSPVEINLTEHDLTNVRMARYADAAVVIVADIERGGVFAQLVGTWELLEPADRSRVVGFLINKFRGDLSLLDSGLDFIRAKTGVPVLGVLPYDPGIQIDQEDSLGLEETASHCEGEPGSDDIDVVVARLPGISNFTDFWPLSRLPGVHIRYIERGSGWGRPDLVIVPGSKTTVRDLDWLRNVGLADRIALAAGERDGPCIIGICGGFQMLGRRIDDPLGVESSRQSVEGLGLLDLTTQFAPTKTRHRVNGHLMDGVTPVLGYEIHMGETSRGPSATPFCRLTRLRDNSVVLDGACHESGRFFGTYVHGLFDSLPYASRLVNAVRKRRGLRPIASEQWLSHRERLSLRYSALGDFLRAHVDLAPIREAMGLCRMAEPTR